jgi:nicotinate-nucleotide adenylyltransferase
MKRIAFYGGSFDPVHNGHLKIARELLRLFELDEFYFIPAFHAPHKRDKQPSSAYHRFAMLSLATLDEPAIRVSAIELEAPEKPYTIETQGKLKERFDHEAKIFFVIGADSWNEIDTWRDWENVLTVTDIVVVTRPGYDIGFSHIPDRIMTRVVDVRGQNSFGLFDDDRIYITDAVNMNISATEIRRMAASGESGWENHVPAEVAKYIKKNKLYLENGRT